MQTKIIDQWDYFYMDNYYLKILVEMGYVGLIFFILLLVALVLIGFRCVYRSRMAEKKAGAPRFSPLAAGILSGLAGVMVHCYFENIFEEPYMMAYFWMMAAMLIYLAFLRERKQG